MSNTITKKAFHSVLKTLSPEMETLQNSVDSMKQQSSILFNDTTTANESATTTQQWPYHFKLNAKALIKGYIRLNINSKSSSISRAMMQWRCANKNCNHNNYCKFINKMYQNQVSHCTLCGISQISSVILKLSEAINLINLSTISAVHCGKNEQTKFTCM